MSPINDDRYDEATGEEVFQDEELRPGIVPVTVEGLVRTDEMPARCYYFNRVLATGANAEKILGADPRRKRVILWGMQLGASVDSVVISESQSACQAFMGAHLAIITVSVRFEISDRGEIWARGCNVNETGGSFTGFAVSGDDVVLSGIVEQWSN